VIRLCTRGVYALGATLALCLVLVVAWPALAWESGWGRDGT
jgi:hypothetical protein